MMMLDVGKIKAKILELSKKRTFKHGLPFVLFVVVASFGLREFTKVRYDYRHVKQVREKLVDVGLPMKPKEELTLDATYEIVKEYDTSNWENQRIERPWDETPKTY